MRKTAARTKDFPRVAFSSSLSPLDPRLPRFYHGEIRVRGRTRKMPATRTVTRHFETLPRSPSPRSLSSLRGKGGIILSLLSNEGISRKQYRNFSSPRSSDFSCYGSRIYVIVIRVHRFYRESVFRLLKLDLPCGNNKYYYIETLD